MEPRDLPSSRIRIKETVSRLHDRVCENAVACSSGHLRDGELCFVALRCAWIACPRAE